MVWVLDMFRPLLEASGATTWHESLNVVFLKKHNVFVLLYWVTGLPFPTI